MAPATSYRHTSNRHGSEIGPNRHSAEHPSTAAHDRPGPYLDDSVDELVGHDAVLSCASTKSAKEADSEKEFPISSNMRSTSLIASLFLSGAAATARGEEACATGGGSPEYLHTFDKFTLT